MSGAESSGVEYCNIASFVSSATTGFLSLALHHDVSLTTTRLILPQNSGKRLCHKHGIHHEECASSLRPQEGFSHYWSPRRCISSHLATTGHVSVTAMGFISRMCFVSCATTGFLSCCPPRYSVFMTPLNLSLSTLGLESAPPR